MNMKKKTVAFNKQIALYEIVVDKLKKTSTTNKNKKKFIKIEKKKFVNFLDDENSLKKVKMFFLHEFFSLIKRKFNKYIKNHENHLIIIANRLKKNMTIFEIYVHKVEKKLRDAIQLKIATNVKILRDIKINQKFEIVAWQMKILFIKMHMCICDIC